MEGLRKRRVEVFDGLLAGGIAALATVEVWIYDELSGARPLMMLLSVAGALALLARRRHPYATLLAVCAVVIAGAAAWNLVDVMTSPFATMLVAGYSVAAYAPQRVAAAGLATLFASLVGVSLVTGERVPLGDVIWVGSILLAVWGAGRLVRAHRETADAMADRAAIAEREREERARAAVAEERARIARELHDVVAHSISVMVVQAGAERRAVGDERPETRDVLATIEQTGREALGEMRRLLGMLRQSDAELELAPQPSMEHIERLVEQVRDAGLPVALDVEGERVPLPPAVDLSAYRIVQEALTNALKHAGPATARVTVRYGRDDLALEIVDDGAGAANGNGDGGGHGLIGMRERVHLFGGNLDAGAAREGGYAVRARLPIER